MANILFEPTVALTAELQIADLASIALIAQGEGCRNGLDQAWEAQSSYQRDLWAILLADSC